MIWLPREILSACAGDADLHYPNESGGAFLGYESEGVLVVTRMVTGGDEAFRGPTAYAPDVRWQNSRISEYYQASGRMDTYLGDWHSHPNTDYAYLSGDDCAVLKKIIKSKEARAPQPIMCVLTGARNAWNMHGWRAELAPRRFWGSLIKLHKAEVMLFDW